jgi:hypothetical protein
MVINNVVAANAYGGVTTDTFVVPGRPKRREPYMAAQIAIPVSMPTPVRKTISMRTKNPINRVCKTTTPSFFNPGPGIATF